MNITSIEKAQLMIDVDTPIEKIAEARTKLESLIEMAKDAKATMDQQMIAWLQANPDKALEWPVDEHGHVRRFYLGHKKTVKCKDVRTAFYHLLTLSVEDAADCLGAGAIKHGAFKKVLPEKFDECFETLVEDKLETGEPKPKQLVDINTKYLNAAS